MAKTFSVDKNQIIITETVEIVTRKTLKDMRNERRGLVAERNSMTDQYNRQIALIDEDIKAATELKLAEE